MASVDAADAALCFGGSLVLALQIA